MLTKHFDNVRQRSENFRVMYAFTASILFTGVIGSLWVFSWFIPNLNTVNNSASVATAIDVGGDLSPTGVVKQEAGNIFSTFFDSMKGLTQKKFMGGQYEVKYDNGTLGLSQNVSVENQGVAGANVDEGVYSTTTSSGVTIEADITDSNLDSLNNPITPNGTGGGVEAGVDGGVGESSGN
jgi:hypothetical protein